MDHRQLRSKYSRKFESIDYVANNPLRVIMDIEHLLNRIDEDLALMGNLYMATHNVDEAGIALPDDYSSVEEITERCRRAYDAVRQRLGYPEHSNLEE